MAHIDSYKRKKFEAAYDTLFEPIYGFLYARLNDRERAKELAQETFMRTWVHMAGGHTIFALRPFLYTTAYNLFKNELRGKRDTLSLERLMEESGFEVRDREESSEKRITMQELFEEIEKLPPHYREPLMLRYTEGWPIKKIAEELVESETTIAVRIHRAIKYLRKSYETIH